MKSGFRRTLLVVLVAALALVWATPFVGAHTELKQADPAPGEVISGDVEFVDLEFFGSVSEPVVTMTDPDGADVPGQVAPLAPWEIRFQPNQPLERVGEYLVSYRVLSEDGDFLDESYVFTWEGAATGTSLAFWIGAAVIVALAGVMAWMLLGRPGVKSGVRR